MTARIIRPAGTKILVQVTDKYEVVDYEVASRPRYCDNKVEWCLDVVESGVWRSITVCDSCLPCRAIAKEKL